MNNENQQTHKGDDILPLPKHEEITSIDKENNIICSSVEKLNFNNRSNENSYLSSFVKFYFKKDKDNEYNNSHKIILSESENTLSNTSEEKQGLKEKKNFE